MRFWSLGFKMSIIVCLYFEGNNLVGIRGAF